MRVSSLLFILIGLCSCNDEGKRSFDEGARALARGDWSMCIEENTNAIRHNRKSWEAYVNRAVCYLQLNRAQQAVDDATTAIALNDTLVQAYLTRAEALDLLNRSEEAQDDLKRATELHPLGASVWIGWAFHHIHNHDYHHALFAADTALLIAPTNETAISLKGAVLLTKKRYDEAISWLKDEPSRPGPMQVINVTNLGFAKSQLGRFGEAKAHLELAMSLDSSSSIVWNNLGFVTFKQGDVEEGTRMIDHAIELDPANSFAHYNRGLIGLAIGDTLDACGRFHQAVKLGFSRDHGPEADSVIGLYCMVRKASFGE